MFLRAKLFYFPCVSLIKRNLSSDVELFNNTSDRFIAKLFGISSKQAKEVLKVNKIETISRADIEKSWEALTALDFTIHEVRANPEIFLQGGQSLTNRYRTLKECGFHTVTVSSLSKYIKIMNRTVHQLRVLGYLTDDCDVVKNMRQHLDLELELPDVGQCNEKSLKDVRKVVMHVYFRKRFDMKDKDFDKLWTTYPRIKHRSLYSVSNVLNLLEKEFHFPKEKLLKNGFLFHCDFNNTQRILKEIPVIAGHDIKEIACRQPKILGNNCDHLKLTLKHINDFGIPDTALSRCMEVLTLSPTTVYERLMELLSIDEFDALRKNPRILRLIHHQNKAKKRLDFLREIKVKCASLHVLTSDSESFKKYVRIGSDKTKGLDVCLFLSQIFSKSGDDIRRLLSRHPDWCHVPLISIREGFEFLRRHKFAVNDIFQNLHLILYPVSRIESKLQAIKDGSLNLSLSPNKPTPVQTLALCLYAIELEFHFTGDGIWTDPVEHHNQSDGLHITNLESMKFFTDSVGDYRYGVKAKVVDESVALS